ncbi:hypothetical protein FACS189459_3400 [Bacilli bacterium]|nr:hypothetical protein FACS189459_3400 [Bacilli bacterium]
MIKIAIQKKGRLNELTVSYLKTKFNIDVPKEIGRELVINKNELEFIFLRDDDIPNLVNMKICDYGIIGSDCLGEQDSKTTKNIQIIDKINNGGCRLMIAGYADNNFSLKSLNGKKIATSFPKLLTEFLKNNNINAEVVIMNGSVECAIKIRYADYICDLVSSGKTLTENKLVPLYNVIDAYPVMIKNINSARLEAICK